MSKHTVTPTSELCKALRKDPVLSLLVPTWACRTIPIPVYEHKLPCLLFFFYPVRGKPGRPKSIFPPTVKVLVNAYDTKLLSLEAAPLFWRPEHSAENPIGEYPGKGLVGLPKDHANEAYRQHDLLCDRLLRSMADNESICEEDLSAWMNSYERIKEEGFSDYFSPFVNQLRLCVTTTSDQLPTPSICKDENTAADSTDKLPAVSVSTGSTMDTALRSCKRFLVASHLDSLLPLWRDIAAHQANTSFSVAVVGEFSRGKSTLINQLLGEDLMPVGDLPTTAILSRIRAGIRRNACHISRDKIQTPLSTSREAFSSFVADKDGCDPEGVLQVELPNKWLAESCLLLFDTPGAGDIVGQRAALTVEAVMRCDAALVIINATLPCSLTEMDFIHDHIISKKLPRISAVISKLDLVQPSERKSVIDYVKTRMHELSPDIEVWTAHTREELPELIDALRVAGPSDIRNCITKWATDADHRCFREVQIRSQLQCLIQNAVLILNDQLAVAKKEEASRISAVNVAKTSLSRALLGWDDIEIELTAKSLETERWMEESLANAQTQLVTDLTYALSQTHNPKQWWEKDFPFQVSRSMKTHAGKIEQTLSQRVTRHEDWLIQTVKAKFAVEQSTQLRSVQLDAVYSASSQDGDNIVDLEQTRKWSRIGILAATALSYVTLAPVFGPAAILGVTGALTLWSESKHKKMIDRQKSDSLGEVANAVDLIFRRVRSDSREKLSALYQDMFGAIKETASKWAEAESLAIEKGAKMSPDDVEHLQNLIKTADTLI